MNNLAIFTRTCSRNAGTSEIRFAFPNRRSFSGFSNLRSSVEKYRFKTVPPELIEELSEHGGRGRRLPNGWWADVIKPLLFTVVVGGGAVYVANSDEVHRWQEQQRIRARERARREQRKAEPNHVALWWNSLDSGDRVLLGVAGANLGVFGMWRVPALQGFMSTYFVHVAQSPRVLPMLLSTFSHISPTHFLFNMIGMYSFGSNLGHVMSAAQLVSMYISGGVVSSFASHMFKLLIRDRAASLGASGAVFAMVASSTYLNPDGQLSIIFLPMFTFTAGSMLPLLVAFDTIGAFGVATRLFVIGLDHVAHLGGVGFGLGYTHWLYQRAQERRRQRFAQW
eukprot:TRINITY_DN10912_c0_g1_i1.p1 TRINITY_DN10912_c0_g1~~TRINITY_DN10912_c0_g1_i1.p1  ORF type:complete len:338 (-),score=76.62 TRINITY_DN10912_c0_g1_i1:763-1776(-)